MKLVIVGGGFAGIWAAIAAAERRRRDGGRNSPLDITIVSRDPYLTVRPRLYERSLDGVRVPIDAVIGALGVDRLQADVTHIDWSERRLILATRSGTQSIGYDRLILAAGSQLNRPRIPGIERAFDVDTFATAEALHGHLRSARGTSEVGATIVVGAGFTGLEVATELASRFRSETLRDDEGPRRVVLVDSADVVARELTDGARLHVERALRELGVEVRLGQRVRSIERDGVTLAGGEWIPAHATIWTGGFGANALSRSLPVEHDALGRIPVDAFLRVNGLPTIYAAGDIARVMLDASQGSQGSQGSHAAPMSCQYAIPMGTLAGANAVSDLLGRDFDLAPFSPAPYVTCLDLGDAGALFTEGFDEDRDVKLTGYWAKRMKEAINRHLIYPTISQTAYAAEPVHRPSAA